MLLDLDQSLENLLKKEMPKDYFSESSNGHESTINFCMPLEDYIGAPPVINLFLYDVRENLELRTSVWSVERRRDPKNQTNNGVVKSYKKPPVPMVDCSYFITAWPSEPSETVSKGEEKIERAGENEHKMLGDVMKVLLRFPQIPEQCLHGSLKGQEVPVRAACLRPHPTQSLGEFWQAMGGKPKTTLNYTVTIPVPIEDREVEFPLVLESTFRLQQQTSPRR